MADEPTTAENEQPEPEPEQPETEPETAGDGPVKVPDDHPLVSALDKVKAQREELRGQVAQFEDAAKTDQEREAERLAELEKSSTAAAAENARLRVAMDKGLSVAQAKRLVGDDEEALSADADKLLEEFGSPSEPPRRPRERLTPGASPSSDDAVDPDELADKILGANRF